MAFQPRGRVVLLINDQARRSRDPRAAVRAAEALRELGWTVSVERPSGPAEAELAAAQAHRDDLLVALGGDGVVARVAAGAVRSGAVVAVVPAGRGNDYARALGVPLAPGAAAPRLAQLTPRTVDVGEVNGRIFVSVACVGVDALANALANRSHLPGAAAYPWSGVRAVTRMSPTMMRVEHDGSVLESPRWNVAVGCSGVYGGGLRVCPDAVLDDGLLDLVSMGAMARWRVFAMLVRMRRGTHVLLPEVSTARAATVAVSTASPMPVYADGDLAGTTPALFTVRPGALRLLA